jgi:hypothetical protein
MKRITLALLLCCTMTIAGCSIAWVTTLDDILAAAAPALINILNIIAIAKGEPLNTATTAKINADAANIKVLASDFASAQTAAAPTVCAQLQAAIQVYSNDINQVLTLAQVSDPATQEKIQVLSGLVTGTVVGILAVIPNCQQAVTMRASMESKSVPLPLKSFINSYNSTLVVPTGIVAVDSYTKKHKIHGHRLLGVL